MSDAVEFQGVGKLYRMYASRRDCFVDVTGLGRIAPWWRPKVDHFWALRDVSFRLTAGSRLGIVGRNGAGKTTLLKLITGNMAPSEGQVSVNGSVQALLEAGAGFHPEFSGLENIRASLIHHGLDLDRIDEAIEEIADFTELGDFLNQPFKTYSAGMQARLVFTTATAIEPDILIIDEILGAGDAYFAGKSRGRMKSLVETGASVLLVSHSLDQVVQFCDEAMWIERGRIVARGMSLEVVRAYEEFIHTLQDRRLKASNRNRKLGIRDAIDVGELSDSFVLALSLSGPPGSRVDVALTEFRVDDLSEETLRVGDVQDADETHLAYVSLGSSGWSEPRGDADVSFRSIEVPEHGARQVLGEMVFRSFSLNRSKHCAFRIRYRISKKGSLVAAASRNGEVLFAGYPLPDATSDWQSLELALSQPELASAGEASLEGDLPTSDREREATAATFSTPRIRRWPGENSLRVDDVNLRDETGEERAVFKARSSIDVCIRYKAERTDVFDLIVVVSIYTIDGIKVSQHASPSREIRVSSGEVQETRLCFGAFDLADGRYVLSVGLFRSLDPRLLTEPEHYDLIDRSYEFEVVGNPPLRTSLVVLPATWEV